MYIYQRPQWPNLFWDESLIRDPLARVRHRQGRFLGRMGHLGFHLCAEAVLQTLTWDVVKTSEIEGEMLDRGQVRSSVARKLGMDMYAMGPRDRHVDGVVEMMFDAINHYDAPLTENRFFEWHRSLFPTGKTGLQKINVGSWRSGPVEVVSGEWGRERVHYEAPLAQDVPREMAAFMDWVNSQEKMDCVLKAAVAHFWFVTIHPFDDGNGRMARALGDLFLARSEESSQRFYSLSFQIQKERKAYYGILESCQKGQLDITDWILWFLGCLERAILSAEKTLEDVLIKAHFWEKNAELSFNGRQKMVINRLLDGFEGKMTSSKWAKITKCSQDTALRDIHELINQGILGRDGAGGRSAGYTLIHP